MFVYNATLFFLLSIGTLCITRALPLRWSVIESRFRRYWLICVIAACVGYFATLVVPAICSSPFFRDFCHAVARPGGGPRRAKSTAVFDVLDTVENSAFYFGVILLGLSLVGLALAAKQVRPGLSRLCARCSYDLRGIKGSPITCPECGKVLDPDEPLL
jgi:hypothetical protein